MQKLKRVLLSVMAVAVFSTSCFAQDGRTKKGSTPRRQLATIVFAGLGGAILGLSTLSFYGRPQDNLANIAIGFAVGIIGGTVYVTMRSATTRDYYDDQNKQQPYSFIDPSELPKFVVAPALLHSAANEPSKNFSIENSSLGGRLVFQF